MKSQEQKNFHHAIRFREDICIGCSHCMNICPTEAIRVKNGKAQMHPNRCIDCGECYRVCPVGAITVEQDDFARIHDYKARVALVPSVFTGQFPDSAGTAEIFSAIGELGFTHVFEVEESVGFLIGVFNQYIRDHESVRPLISPFCPAIVRLIQVKFPTLTGNIVPYMAPVEITALHALKALAGEGYRREETGLFYVTPCAAKIVAVKSPVGEEHSVVDGVISMSYLYNKVYKILREKKSRAGANEAPLLPGKSVCWSLTHGEADHMENGRSLAIDEINNVIEFLEKIENEEIDGIDFLELRACDESCAGGILCPGNRFLTVDKLRKRAARANETSGEPSMNKGKIISFPEKEIRIGKIPPRSIMKLDDQVAAAMVKMKRIYDLNRALPQVDCGICGSPTCRSLAEDVVQEHASIRQCIFIQKIMEQNEQLDLDESVRIMRAIWSENKLDKNGMKAEINEFK